ncbi:MAG TPA: hypothetical protein VFG83_10270 [Kofleriaceae bacterium]|nr:hypothetical protein [Kofleriaceae bacterium]
MSKLKIKVPKDLRPRLKDVGRAHNLGSMDDVVDHFITRGLKQYDVATDGVDVGKAIDQVVDDQGYSSAAELIEHLLLRGLSAYEQKDEDPAALEARLRGLGYID